MRLLLSIILVLGSEVGMACTFDTDCDVGSTCIKSGYSMNGVCTKKSWDYGSERPNDRGAKPYDGGGKAGESCSFNTQCGIGGQCVKTGSSLYGVCTK